MLRATLMWVDEIFSKLLGYIPERVIQIGMVMLLIGWVGYQIQLFDDYFNKIQWFLETTLYAIYLLIYVRRPKAKQRALHLHEVLLPLIGASLPFLFLLTPITVSRQYFAFSLWLLTLAVFLVIISAVSLGTSFSITVEVRELRQRGMYKLVRHPMYASQIFSGFIMVFLLRFSWINVILFLLFVGVQITRARLEEKKLLTYYPKEYAEYQKKTKMLIPFLF